MGSAFTAYWRAERFDHLPEADPGPRLAVLFGGPHVSQPSFLRAGAEPGDMVFPITVRDRRLYVVASMRIREIVRVEEDDHEMGGLLPRYAEWSFLAATCTSEVVVGEEGTPIRRDRQVPAEVLARWRFLNRRGERALRHVDGDRLLHASPVDKIYRLHPETAADLARIVGPGLALAAAPAGA